MMKRLLLSLCLSLCCGVTHAADDDERFLAGLRQRRLFTLAEAYCDDRLATAKLDDAERAMLVMEAMLTLSQHALYAPPAEREALGQRARALATKIDFEHPRKSVVDLQAALVTLAQGELARQEAEAANVAPEEYAAAQKYLRTATNELETLEKRVAQQIATRRDPVGKGQLSAEELFALQHNLRYQLARARRNQALCYPPGSNDRVAALGQAVEQLDKLVPQLAEDEPLLARIKIDQGICLRLQSEYAAAVRTLSPLIEATAPLAIQQQARAELARIALAQRQLEAARKIIDAGRNSAETNSPELEFALLEVYVALWKTAADAKDTQNAGRYREQAVAQLALIERLFGAYWARRGDWLVIDSAGSDDQSSAILIRSADARFLKGQFDDETLKMYDEAGKQVLAAGELDKVLELGFRAATVQQRRGKLADAAQRLQTLSLAVAERATSEDPAFAQSSALHWQGLRWWRQAATGQGELQDADLIARYLEHVQTWPQQPSAGDARYELGHLYERQSQWFEALEAYQQVPADHARYVLALDGVARVLPPLLVKLSDQPKAKAEAVTRTMKFFREVIAPAGQPLPTEWTEAQRLAAVCAARLLLQSTADGAAEAEQLLTAALAASPMAAASWRSAAQGLQVVALAAQPQKRAAAEQLLAKLGGDNPQQLLEMLQGLTSLSVGANEGVRRDLAKLQLSAIKLLDSHTQKLTPAQRIALARIEAAALADAGERAAALTAYAALVKAHPQHGALQEGYAELLAAGEDRGSLQQALGQWRVIALASKPQSERWWKAKYQVALLAFKLGDKAQAAQLIRYLEVTPPGLENSPLKREFRELLARCQE
ncbi:MAG TPA: hypothetical protein VL096_06855 [Pirellulaceae bacterium]|nr:hypothetical protein [Pirellulaceae bacterium]